MAIEGEREDLRDQIAGVAEGVLNNGKAISGLDGRVQRLTAEVNDLRTEQSRAFADVLTVLQDVRNHTQGIPSLSERLQKGPAKRLTSSAAKHSNQKTTSSSG